MFMMRPLRSIVVAMLGIAALCSPIRVRADILDAEIWSNHIEEIQQINNLQQFRHTMNRGFDAMSVMVPGGGTDVQSTAAKIADEHARWNATLVLAPYSSRRELDVFLNQGGFSAEARRSVEGYLLRQFAAFPAKASAASFNPQNVADVRLFALETAYRIVRPDDTTPMPATMLIDIGLQRQMSEIYRTRGLSAQQKQDVRDYYVIARAVFLPALRGSREFLDTDVITRRSLIEIARAFVIRDAAVDPMSVSWSQLPCVGASAVECQVHMAMAKAALQTR
jgi:hypothetical protein